MTPNPMRIVEAALFSSGKPMLPEQIQDATGLPMREVRAALTALQKDYAAADSALEVAPGGQKWAMQLKAAYSEKARKLAPMEVPLKVLKTLALIAFHQPLRQSELKDMVGTVVYDHVHEPKDRGMVTSRADGNTRILATTDRFLEYFGLAAGDRHAIKTILAERVGIDPSKLLRTDPNQVSLPSEAPSDPAPAEDAGAEPLKAVVP